MYFTYNGKTSEEMGIKLTLFAPPERAEESADSIAVPGRSAPIIKRKGQYNMSSSELAFVLFDRTMYRKIMEWLSGSGQLIFSDEPDKEYTVFMTGKISSQRIGADGVMEIHTNVDFMPFAYALEPTTTEISKNYTLIRNPGTIYSEPVITFKSPASAEPVLMGDVDMDGKITAADAALVMEEVGRLAGGMEGTFTERQKAAADMDGDGKLTAADAAAILSLYAQQSAATSGAVSEQIIIDVNGAKLIVGLPASAVGNDYTITIDSAEKLIYYTNGDGKRVNIMQYSYGDLPLLHTGDNYAKFSGNAADVIIAVNERWL